jgi:hypothetical protein
MARAWRPRADPSAGVRARASTLFAAVIGALIAGRPTDLRMRDITAELP